MSTIRHPVQNHAWWYVAAAAVVLAGLVAALMASVLTDSGSTGTQVAPAHISTLPYRGRAYAVPCFPGRPDGSVELGNPACRAGTP